MKVNLKKGLALIASLAMLLPMAPKVEPEVSLTADAANVLAFPGAVGGGKYATGGRGGEVYHVTNLNDSGTGSLRDAVSQSNRIVVFDVSGTIELKSNIVCQSNITIAGQTAPGGSGVTLKNYKFGMGGDNIICRFISSRPGPYASTTSGNDAWGGAAGSNSIIDHCSMGWTTDEQWGLYSNNEYYTVQYSVIGPADSWGGHSKGIHGFGLMMGKGYSTFDHNLIVHNVSRNFRGKVVGTSTADFTNNVIYNWAYQTAYGTIGHLNYVNNTLKMGNGTVSGKHYVYVDSSTSPENFSIYCTGNRMLNQDGSVYDTVTTDNWNGISVKDGLGITKDGVKSTTAFQTLIDSENVSTATTCESAAASYENVLTYAGNGISSDTRTAIDQQSAYECRTGTGNLSGTSTYEEATDDEKSKLDGYSIECGVTYEYPEAILTKTITDSDNDGMPDEWELARGLNPDDASDTNGDYCGQGYTNIEYYINDLTVDAFPEGTVTLSPELADVPTINAFETIEAESFSTQSGIKTEECTEGGENVGYIENGDYIMFRNVDFEDGAKSFYARIAGTTDGADIEIYIDSLSNTPVGTCKAIGTGNWQEWLDVSCNIATTSGVHTVYLKFVSSAESYLININHFVFGRDAIPINGTLITQMYVNDTERSSYWSIGYSLADDSILYGDRTFTYVGLPSELVGAEYIVTSCDSKYYDGDLAVFTAGADIDVYVAFDVRVTNERSWLSDWEKTDLSFTSSNDVTFEVYKKSVSQGQTVTLGTNGQSSSCINYTAMAVERQSAGSVIWGDANADGIVNSIDATMVTRHALQVLTLSDEAQACCDVNGDGTINSIDATLIVRYSLGVVTAFPVESN